MQIRAGVPIRDFTTFDLILHLEAADVKNVDDDTEVFANPPPDVSSLVMVQTTRTRRTQLGDD